MKRKYDMIQMTNEWNSPPENALAQSVLIGSWAEGLDYVQPEVHALLERKLKLKSPSFINYIDLFSPREKPEHLNLS